ncbi:MAG: TldD/PmbA family protein [Candidatus Hodarchaeota archaeon]
MDIEELKRIATVAMELGEKQNPDEIGLFIEFNKNTNVNIENGRISGAEQAVDTGLGCQITFGTKVAQGFTTDLSRGGIEKTIIDTAKTAQKSEEDKDWMGLVSDSGTPSTNQFFHPSLLNTEINELAEISTALLNGSKLEGIKDPIIPVFGITSLGVSKSVVMNTHGVETTNETSYFYIVLASLAIKEGSPGPTSFDFWFSRKALHPDPSGFATDIAKEAWDLTRTKKVKLPETMSVIFHPFALNSISENIFFPALLADRKQQGNSYLADRIGEELVPKDFDMWDDGTLPECTKSGYFDIEGIAKRKTPIFQEGVFTNFLYDHTTAQKDRTLSTGNAQRNDTTGVNPGSYANPVSVGTNNWVIKPGTEDLDSLIADIKTGILIKGVQGAHQGSPESGDYTGVVNPGYIIQDGSIAEPVVGFGLAGKMLELFSNFEGATSTARSVGDAFLPHVRFGNVRVVS